MRPINTLAAAVFTPPLIDFPPDAVLLRDARVRYADDKAREQYTQALHAMHEARRRLAALSLDDDDISLEKRIEGCQDVVSAVVLMRESFKYYAKAVTTREQIKSTAA